MQRSSLKACSFGPIYVVAFSQPLSSALFLKPFSSNTRCQSLLAVYVLGACLCVRLLAVSGLLWAVELVSLFGLILEISFRSVLLQLQL